MSRTLHKLRSLNRYDAIARREIQELRERVSEVPLPDDPLQLPQAAEEHERQITDELQLILQRWKERKRVNKKGFYKPSARAKRMLWIFLAILTLFVLFFLFESFRH